MTTTFDHEEYVRIEARFRTAEDLLVWIERSFDELIPIFGFDECGQGERRVKEEAAPIRCGTDLLEYLKLKRFSGCSIYGDRCEGHMFRFDNDVPSEVVWSCEPDDPRIVENWQTIFRGFARGQAWYAASYCWGEFTDRHVIEIPTRHERRQITWRARLGTDIRRYVPGLYWLNYLSFDYCRHLGIDLEELVTRTGAERYDYPEGVVLKLYDHPRNWQAHRDRILDAIDPLPYVFSLRRVDPVPEGLTPREALEWDNKMHSRWP